MRKMKRLHAGVCGTGAARCGVWAAKTFCWNKGVCCFLHFDSCSFFSSTSALEGGCKQDRYPLQRNGECARPGCGCCFILRLGSFPMIWEDNAISREVFYEVLDGIGRSLGISRPSFFGSFKGTISTRRR